MLFNKQVKHFVLAFNYKDIFIIFVLWFISSLMGASAQNISFSHTPFLEGYFHYLFYAGGRFLFFGLTVFYLISFYSPDFKELGFHFNPFWLAKKISPFRLLIGIIFIFTPFLLEFTFTTGFQPLDTERILLWQKISGSLPSLLLIFLPSLIVGLGEQFMLNNIIFEVFRLKLPGLLAIPLTALFYPALLLEFSPEKIFPSFLVGIFCVYLYIKTEGSLVAPMLLTAGHYTLYLGLLQNWSFIY